MQMLALFLEETRATLASHSDTLEQHSDNLENLDQKTQKIQQQLAENLPLIHENIKNLQNSLKTTKENLQNRLKSLESAFNQEISSLTNQIYLQNLQNSLKFAEIEALQKKSVETVNQVSELAQNLEKLVLELDNNIADFEDRTENNF